MVSVFVVGLDVLHVVEPTGLKRKLYSEAPLTAAQFKTALDEVIPLTVTEVMLRLQEGKV